MKLQIPIGSEINNTDNNLIKIRIRNTRYWVQGERKGRNLWDLYMIDPTSTYKELIRENMTTKAFAILTNMTLKTPFPHIGKRAEDRDSIKRFINNNIRLNKYEQRKRSNKGRFNIIRKSRKIQAHS